MDETMPTDAELWRQSARLRVLARALVGDAGLGEDLAQEAWVAALRRPGAAAESVAGWLSGTVRHLARRLGQRERQRAEVEQRAARAEAVEGPEEAVLRAEALQELGRAVLALEEPYRSAVILRHLEQLEPGEIARRQGCSRAAARQRVARGLAELRRRLDHEHGGRERWCRALIPLARPLDGSGIAVGAGGVLMAKWIVAVVAVLVVCVWWRGTRGRADGASGTAQERVDVAASVSGLPVQASEREPVREELVATGARTAESLSASSDERTLRGRVVDPAGAPVAGARVTLRWPELRGFSSLDLTLDPEGELLAETSSDDAGTFSFELDAGLLVQVRAEKSGIGEAALFDRSAGEELELRLASSFRLVGRVTRASDGQPVAEVDVQVQRPRDHGLSLRRRVRTDADGRYELHLPVGDNLRVDVSPRDEQGRFNLHPSFNARGEARLDVEVVEGFAVEGTVTDADTGQPIAGALVGESWTMGRTTRTDAAGRYRFTGFGADGVYDLHARAEGYGGAIDYPPPGSERTRQLDFALRRARSVVGTIVDPEGAPVAGVYVAAIGSGKPGEVDWSAARTDAEGRFRCADLRAELRHTLLLHARECASLYYDFPVEELTSRELDLGTIALTRPGVVAGRALDADGVPVPGARVRLAGHNADRRRWCAGEDHAVARGYTDERGALADEHGRFRFVDVAPGRYRLAATAEGRARSPSVEVALDLAGARAEVEVVFSEGGDLLGRVVDELGQPIEGVLVRIQSDTAVDGLRLSTKVRSLADGTFSARQLPPALTYSLEVFPFDVKSEDPCAPWLYSSLEAISPAHSPVTLVLLRGTCIEGRVLDEFDRPRDGLQLAIQNSKGEHGLGTSTDSEGHFLLGVEPNTTWTLTVSGPKKDAGFTLLSVAPNIAAGTRDLVLRIPR